MGKVFLPVILVFLSAGVFVGFTDKRYQAVKVLQSEQAKLLESRDALDLLAKQIEALLEQEKGIEQGDLARLRELLPDAVDNIRLILDIDQVAAKHGLVIKNVKVGDISGSTNPSSTDVAKVGSVTISFSVSATYDIFRSFVNDLEKSLRLVDISSIALKTSDKGVYEYNLTLRTYWLK